MEIQGPGGVSGPQRAESDKVPVQNGEQASQFDKVSDRVEISEHAKLLEKLAEVPAIRAERVKELQRLIEAGEFETPERLERAIEKMIEEENL